VKSCESLPIGPLRITISIQRDRKKIIDHKQTNDVTIKIINLCGRLPVRKFSC